MPSLKSNLNNYKYTTLYAAGEVYISSIIDTLTCQAYFNPNIVNILQQLLKGNTVDDDEEVAKITRAHPDLLQSNLQQIPVPESCVVSDWKIGNGIFVYRVKALRICSQLCWTTS